MKSHFTAIALLTTISLAVAQIPVPPMKPEAVPAKVMEATEDQVQKPMGAPVSREDSIKNRTPMPLDGYMAVSIGIGSALGDLARAPVRGAQDMERFPGYASDVLDLAVQAGGYFTPYLGIGARFNYTTLFGMQGSLTDALKTVGEAGQTTSYFGYTASSFMMGPRLKYDHRNTEYYCMPVVGFAGIAINNLNSSIGSALWYRGTLGWGVSTGIRTKGRIGLLLEVNYTDLGQRDGVLTTTANNKMVPDAVAGANDFRQHVAWYSVHVGLSFRIRDLKYSSSTAERSKAKQVLKAKPSVPVMP